MYSKLTPRSAEFFDQTSVEAALSGKVANGTL